MAKGEPVASLNIELRAIVDKFRGDMASATSIITNAEKNITGAFDHIGSVAKAALAVGGVFAVKKLSDALHDLANRGEVAGSIAENFEKLGGSGKSIEEAKKKVLGLVDSFDLMKIANEGLLKRIPNLNENFGKMADFAARFADATGQDTKAVLEQLTDALGKGAKKQLEYFGIQVKGETTYQRQISFLSQLEKKTNSMAEAGDSAANAHDALTTSVGEALTKIGIAINQNDALRDMYRQLAEQIDKIDWAQVGKDISSMITSIVNALPSLQSVVGVLEDIAGTVRFITGNTSKKDALGLAVNAKAGEIAQLRKEIELRKSGAYDNRSIGTGPLMKWLDKQTGAELSGIDPKKTEELEKKLAQAQKELIGLSNEYNNVEKAAKPAAVAVEEVATAATPKGGKTVPEVIEDDSEEAANKAKKLAEEMKKLRDGFANAQADLAKEGFADQLDKAIKNVDPKSFAKALEGYKEAVKTETAKGFEEAVSKGAVAKEAVDKFAVETAEKAGKEYEEQMRDAVTESANTARDKLIEAHTDAVNAWRDVFSTAIDGGTQDLETTLKEIAIGFGSELAASLGGNPGTGGGSLADIGGVLASSILGAFGGNGGGGGSGGGASFGGASSGGSGASAGMWGDAYAAFTKAGSSAYGEQGWGDNPEGFYGPGGDPSGSGTGQAPSSEGGGSAGYIQAGATVIGSALSASDTNKKNNDNSGTGAAAGAAVGTAIGAYFGGPWGAALGASLGAAAGGFLGGLFKTGSQNPQTQARHLFANWLEDSLSQVGEIIFKDKDGLRRKFDGNFLEGDRGRFSQPGWADSFAKMPNASTFAGLGEALREINGIKEGIGDQLGFLLAENLAGDVDNARTLVQSLGLDLGKVEEALVAVGRRGDKTWHEIEVDLQGVANAFAPGLAAIADMGGAFDNLVNSGGRGFDAIKSVRDIGIEALEGKLTSFEQLRAKLISEGASPEYVDALFTALQQRGVTTLDQLAKLTDRVAGGVVADMESLGVKWGDALENVNKMNEALEKMPKSVETDINLNFHSTMDDDTKAALDAGLIGTDGSVPDTVDVPETAQAQSSGGTTINIDARGADAGVEHRIRHAARTIEQRSRKMATRTRGE